MPVLLEQFSSEENSSHSLSRNENEHVSLASTLGWRSKLNLKPKLRNGMAQMIAWKNLFLHFSISWRGE